MFSAFVALAVAVTAPLQPMGKWAVEYSRSGCTLYRSFENADQNVVLAFKPAPAVQSGELVIIFMKNRMETRSGSATIRVSSDESNFNTSWISDHAADGRSFVRLSVEQDVWKALESSQTVSISLDKADPLNFSLPGWSGALKALKVCEDDLLRSWGVDPAFLITNYDRPMMSWFRSDDYPMDSIRRAQQGRVQTVSSFDRAGRVMDCKVVVSSGYAALNKVTCAAIWQRARVPSVDKEGPVKRYVVTNAIWAMPSR